MTTDTPVGSLATRHGTAQFVAAGLDTARARIAQPDLYIASQSPFDRHARMGIPQAAAPVDQALFTAFLTTQVMEWTDTELAALQRILTGLAPVFGGIDMTLPPRVTLIKTTGREEGAAAYTRHKDVIVLPVNMVASILSVPPGGDPLHPGQSDGYLSGIVTHECFHLMSKNTPDARARLYADLDFRLLARPVDLPDDPAPCGLPMRDLRITNPDAPLIDVALPMVPPGGDAPALMAPALMSSGPYLGGAFFETLEWVFVQLEADETPARRDGRAVILPSGPMMPQYLRHIGRNLTGELFHPDEVLAQSFVLAAPEPDLRLLQTVAAGIWPARAGA